MNLVVGLFTGGVATEFVRRVVPSQEVRVDSDRKLRVELWERMVALEAQLKELQNENKEWQKLYYRQDRENALLLSELNAVKARLERAEQKLSAYRNVIKETSSSKKNC